MNHGVKIPITGVTYRERLIGRSLPLTLLLVDKVMLDVVVLETLEVRRGGCAVMQVVVYEVIGDVPEYDSGTDAVCHAER